MNFDQLASLKPADRYLYVTDFEIGFVHFKLDRGKKKLKHVFAFLCDTKLILHQKTLPFQSTGLDK